jgi:hypothetical protein
LRKAWIMLPGYSHFGSCFLSLFDGGIDCAIWFITWYRLHFGLIRAACMATVYIWMLRFSPSTTQLHNLHSSDLDFLASEKAPKLTDLSSFECWLPMDFQGYGLPTYGFKKNRHWNIPSDSLTSGPPVELTGEAVHGDPLLAWKQAGQRTSPVAHMKWILESSPSLGIQPLSQLMGAMLSFRVANAIVDGYWWEQTHPSTGPLSKDNSTLFCTVMMLPTSLLCTYKPAVFCHTLSWSDHVPPGIWTEANVQQLPNIVQLH